MTRSEPGERVPGFPASHDLRRLIAPLILLVDDHPAIRQGLALVLEAEGLGECREAWGRDEALEIVGQEAPDLALVGLSMEREETTTLVTELRSRGIPVVVCSLEESPAHVKRAMAAGARAYVTRADAPMGIVRAVRDVLAGWILISPTAAEELDEAGWQPDPEVNRARPEALRSGSSPERHRDTTDDGKETKK